MLDFSEFRLRFFSQSEDESFFVCDMYKSRQVNHLFAFTIYLVVLYSYSLSMYVIAQS